MEVQRFTFNHVHAAQTNKAQAISHPACPQASRNAGAAVILMKKTSSFLVCHEYENMKLIRVEMALNMAGFWPG